MTILFEEPLPGDWTHNSGFRLESGITYKHEEYGLIGTIECGRVSEAAVIDFTIKVCTTDGEPVEGPRHEPTKSKATTKLHEWLNAHA